MAYPINAKFRCADIPTHTSPVYYNTADATLSTFSSYFNFLNHHHPAVLCSSTYLPDDIRAVHIRLF